MKKIKTVIHLCFALSLAACGGGGGSLSIDHPEGGTTLQLNFPLGQAVEHRLPFRIAGGIPPYDLKIDRCPVWVTLFPDQRILVGTAPAQDQGKTFFCTFLVTESDPGVRPARSVSYGLSLTVGSVSPLILSLPPGSARLSLTIGIFHSGALPAASGGVQPYTYSFACAGGALPFGMAFAPATRVFVGTPGDEFRDSCTYTVTDSSQPAATVSVAVEVEVEVTGAATQPLTLPESIVPGDPVNRVTLNVRQHARVTFAGGIRGCTALHLSYGWMHAPRRFALQPGRPHSVRHPA